MTTHLQGQLRVLTVNEGEVLDTTIFRLEKGWTLQFVLGPSLAAKDVKIFVNHPKDGKSGPNRQAFRHVPWQRFSSHKAGLFDRYAEVPIVLSGSFNYYLTIDGSDDPRNASGSGYFLVDPALKCGQYDERLPLDCITCQTVLAKSLGPFQEWKARLEVAKESGYNMIHFTPLQSLGGSNSSYCLRDQLQPNPIFNRGGEKCTFEEIGKLVDFMKNEWGVLSMTDLVFNHTANESEWIAEHPECAYNLINSPHLKPAYLLDRILWHLSIEVGDGKWEDWGAPAHLRTEDHLNNIRRILWEVYIPKYRIHEYYLLHVDDTVEQFRNAITAGTIAADPRGGAELEIIPDPKYRKLKAIIDMPLALHKYNVDKPGMSESDRVNTCCHDLRCHLEALNAAKFGEVQSHLEAAVTNLMANARWRFIDGNGPRVDKVSAKEPIMYNYFTLPKEKLSLDKQEELMHTDWGSHCMAHNGWVMNDDPLRNFAEPGSNIYLRRELIPWGDSVKLRYGSGPDDCPYLWQHMRDYTVMTASIFHGVRLDNCHSTPIHVAEYMLDEARKARPDLYVIAELFTSSPEKDNIFINRLGLTSLIRESLNAWDSHELGRVVHRFGGNPVGAFIQSPARPLVASVAHAILLDQTHDNPSAVEKRSAYDLFPSSALVAMSSCATGSNRGHDELVPHHINVVTEPRVYQSWAAASAPKQATGQVTHKTGIVAGKRALNTLHVQLAAAGFNQLYVDQVDADIVAVTRHNPISHQSVILVARTAFSHPHSLDTGYVPPLCVPGVIDEVILEGRYVHRPSGEFKRDKTFINGLPDYHLQLREHIKVTESEMVELRHTNDKDVQEAEFINFPPGSVIAFRVSLNTEVKQAVLSIRNCLSQFGYRMHTYSGRNLKEFSSTELEAILTRLSLNDLNRVLYRCDAEEHDDGLGFGAYHVPGHGYLPYCGLQGLMSILSKTRACNDLGHPLFENIRSGDWMLNYIADRLKPHPGTKDLGDWFSRVFAELVKIPRYLIPCYFDAIVTGVFVLVEEIAWAKMPPFVRDGPAFLRALAMGSLQFCSFVKTGPLPALSPNLAAPSPPVVQAESGRRMQTCTTLSAGLPHFANALFRNWGRDTFISLRGLMLLTGREAEARFVILAYAATLRHGLIPNLLGAGVQARYNCRDAVWWWLQCIQDYCTTVKDGYSILKDKVSRLYITDDSLPEQAGIWDQPLLDVIQEALQRHADGVAYRERDAGPGIDKDMADPGFNNNVGIDWDTGFVHGGNVHNCGTWMDKNGSSDKARNRGKPATPRDGSAVELVALCKSTVSWLHNCYEKGLYPYAGVTAKIKGEQVKVDFKQWAQRIQDNFEKFFWIHTSAVPENEPRPDLVNRRGIYKDSHGASQPWADYQLRPNFPVAMVVAPELFTARRAWTALSNVRKILLGPLGMKTLDPSDYNYNGYYINSDDSHDPRKARGYNYHNGPEWVWPVGYFLRAQLLFARRLEAELPGVLQDTARFVRSVLSNHNTYITSSDWRSLPELTNQDGAQCHDSCEAQAWSVASILEVLYDMEKLN